MLRCSIQTTALSRVDLLFLLNRLVDLDKHLYKTRRLPPLYQSGVRYRREWEDVTSPAPREEFLAVDALYAVGFGDCEDLASARCAELLLQKKDAHIRLTRVNQIYHVTVRIRERGRSFIEDPSKLLGMQGEA